MIHPALLGAAIGMAMLPRPLLADVLEIGAGGVVAVRASDSGAAPTSAPDGASDADPIPDIPAAALTMIDTPLVPAAYQASLQQAAATAHVSPTLLAALVWQESRWHPAALSPKGARGLTQLMPGTARALAVDAKDDNANLVGGARYLRSMLDMFNGNIERALAAYNAGPVRVLRSTGLPAIAETRAYVASIIDRLGIPGPAALQGVKP